MYNRAFCNQSVRKFQEHNKQHAINFITIQLITILFNDAFRTWHSVAYVSSVISEY
jgi:hypothetical protein